jgi:predicted transposase YbfD/YdcC
LPVKAGDKEKRTNEIKTAIPLLESLDIQGKTITADALLTQRELAEYIALKSNAHYHFIAKGNHKTLLKEVASFFENVSWAPDHTTKDKPNHGRNESRRSWVTTELNTCLKFPHVDQAFKIERVTCRKKKFTSCRVRNHQ